MNAKKAASLWFLCLLMGLAGCGGSSSTQPPPPPVLISVQISPSTVTLFQGATQRFTATITGTSNTAVTWSVQEGSNGGTIDNTGLYTAPRGAAGTFHVVATSQADLTANGSAAVVVPVTGLTISPVSATLGPGGTQAFTAAVAGLVDTSVTWAVQEAACGVVSSAGFYTAPMTTGFYHVAATSDADATLSGSATVTVTTSSARFTPTGDMTNAHGLHTATLLADGRVLMAGGATNALDPLCLGGMTSAELYDSSVGSSTSTGSMTSPRYSHTATSLLNGEVLVTGGFGSVSDCEDLGTPVLSSAELYNPSTGSFKATGGMGAARVEHTATLLPNGKVLVAGGHDKTAELYDPATGGFTSTGSMATPRSGQTATLLANGRVLIAGGVDTTDPKSPVATAAAEIYDSSTGTFTPTNNMMAARAGHTATLLATGRVLIAGGSDLATAEVYDPAAGSFSPTGGMGQTRASHTATLLPNGNVLVTGGSDSTAELYEPATGSFSTTGSMEIGRWGHTATLLLNGKVLVAGGGARPPLATAELYK